MRCLQQLVALTAAAAIHPTIAASDLVLDETRELTGRELWTRAIQLPTRDLLLVTVHEIGADVELTVTEGAVASYSVDSPIERNGLMAVVLAPNKRSTTATIRVAANEPKRYRGAARVTVRQVPTANHDEVRAWLHLMRAGQSHAQLKKLRGSAPDPTETTRLSTSAISEYSMSRDAAKAAGLKSLFAFATLHLARMTYDEQSDYDKTVELTSVAESTMRSAHEEFGATRAASLQAAALRDGANALKKSTSRTAVPAEVSARFARAIELFRRVQQFHASRQERFEAAQAINNIGLAYYLQGDYASALAEYDRAIPMFHAINDGPNEARTIQNVALTRYELGDRGCAPGYDQALGILDRADDLQLYGDILNNGALCHRMLGNFDRALRLYEEAFRVQSSLQNELQVARSLHGMAGTYFGLGDLTTALDMYEQALSRRPAAKDARGRASTLSALGNIACERGQYQPAAAHYEEALTLAVAPLTRARMQLRFARCLTKANRTSDALIQLQAVDLSAVSKEGVIQALVHLERGRVHAATASWPSTAREISAALPLLVKYELAEEQAEALTLAAAAAVARENKPEAMRYVDQGIRLGEHVRARSNNPELRATLFAPWRKFYDLKIGLLVAGAPSSLTRLPSELAGRTLQVSEAARARALEELLLQAKTATSTSAAPSESERLLAELSEKRAQLALAQERGGIGDARSQYLLRDAAALRTRLDAMSASSGNTPVLTAPATSDIPSVPDDTAVLVYWLGEHHALAWVLTNDGLEGYGLGSSEATHAAAMRLHEALASPSTSAGEVNRVVRDASKVILPPSQQLGQKRRWIVVADGPLHHVPFGALRLAGSDAPAVAAHEISVAPALRLLSPRSVTVRSIRSALLIADPVFGRDDDRMRALSGLTAQIGPSPGLMFPRLRGSGTEIERITNQLAGTSITRLVGWQANREQVVNALRTPFDVVHIATHSRVDAEVPQLSAIVLSRYDQLGREQSPWLHASELRSPQLKNALFVLSACETALGKSVGGEGLVGLSYSLLSAGARGVLASTWRVADAATVDYMDAFYRSLRHDPNLASAAAHASRTLMQTPRWKEPRYWAAFVAYQNEI